MSALDGSNLLVNKPPCGEDDLIKRAPKIEASQSVPSLVVSS